MKIKAFTTTFSGMALLVILATPAIAAPPPDLPAKAQHVKSAMTPEEVAALFDNSCVDAALENEFAGKASLLVKPNGDVVLSVKASNLLPGMYHLFVDRDGFPPGPAQHVIVASATVDDKGKADIEVTWPAGAGLPGGDGSGNYTWDLYLDIQLPACGLAGPGTASVLGAVGDLSFSI